MKVSEAIRMLQEFLEHYGDCRLMSFYGFGLSDVECFQFIGGQRLLIVSEDEFERRMWRLYNVLDGERMFVEGKKWLEDCESD